MKLHVGERLPGSGPPAQPGGYLVAQVLRETPWSNLYAARKILYNFDFAGQRCRESDEAEWLDVLLRTCSYFDLESPQDMTQRRAAARAEVCTVLANRDGNVWPEPLDLLERDGTGEAEPVVVLEKPHGETLAQWLTGHADLGERLTLLSELLTFVEAAHRDGFLLNGLGPDAFVVDGRGRIGYLASDSVVPKPWRDARLFPPERYPVGFSAPECFDPAQVRDERSDLFAWAAVAWFVLTGADPEHSTDANALAGLEELLRPLAAGVVARWAASLEVDAEACAAVWPHNLVRLIQRGLALSPRDRPADVTEARRWLVDPPARLALPEAPAKRVAEAPRADPLAKQWDRVFAEGDRASHERVVQQLSPLMYRAALEAELLRRADGLIAARWQELPRLARCLPASAAALPQIVGLLHSQHPPVREIVQGVLLAELASRLSGPEVTAWHVRSQLDKLCPPDQLEDKIQLCRGLPRSGVKADAATECLAQLEQELPVQCPLCGSAVQSVHLETHLRRAHRVFQYGGQVHSLQDTLTALLDALFNRRPDAAAWTALETISKEEYPAQAEGFLTQWFGQRLLAAPNDQRPTVTAALADILAASPSGQRMAVVCAAVVESEWQALSFQLSLEIAARLPVPLAGNMLAAVQPRLADKRVPAELRLRAAAQLLRGSGPTGPATAKLLAFLVANTGKAKGIERLQRLEQLAGKMPAIDALCAELENQVRMSCPRCGVELRRVEMTRHLWDEHRLMLDGRRVRDPWRMIEDWLEDYRVEGETGLLEQCRQLADRLDPRGGSRRLRRLLLQHGIEDAQARQELLKEAREQRASLCPHCFTLVPSLAQPALPKLTVERDLLEGGGFTVELSHNGLAPHLFIETPRGTLYDSVEPGRHLTKLGALLFFASPFFAIALMLAVLPLQLPVPGRLLAALCGGLGIIVVALILAPALLPEDPLGRMIDLAWARLLPELLDDGLTPDDRAFVAALAERSVASGDTEKRAGTVTRSCAALEKAVTQGAPAAYLGAVWRLALHDDGVDLAPRLADQAGRSFDGSMPLGFAAVLLMPPPEGEWPAGMLQRLRVLLCARAFDAGLELRELLDLAAAEAPLGMLLDGANQEYLAHMRLLRMLQPSRPWQRIGPAKTVYEIAQSAKASRRLLERQPDLLLVADEKARVHLCSRGVALGDVWFFEVPREIQIVARTLFPEGGYHLVVGQYTVWFADDPTELAGRLEKWLRYFFQEFRPGLAAVYRGRSIPAAQRLLARNGVNCPGCRRRVLPVPGEMGCTADAPMRDEVPIVLPVG